MNNFYIKEWIAREIINQGKANSTTYIETDKACTYFFSDSLGGFVTLCCDKDIDQFGIIFHGDDEDIEFKFFFDTCEDALLARVTQRKGEETKELTKSDLRDAFIHKFCPAIKRALAIILLPWGLED